MSKKGTTTVTRTGSDASTGKLVRPKTPGLQYTDAAEWAKKASSGSGGGSLSVSVPEGTTFYKLLYNEEQPRVYLDILPYEAGEENPNADKGIYHFERTYYRHFIPDADGGGRFVVCLKETYSEDCPVCEHIESLQRAGHGEEDSTKKLAAKMRQLFNVMDAKNRSAGPMLWDVSFYNFGKQLKKEMADPYNNMFGFFQLDTGCVVEIRVEMATFSKRIPPYPRADRIEFSERTEALPASLLDRVLCLDDLVAHPTYAEVAVLIGSPELEHDMPDSGPADDAMPDFDDTPVPDDLSPLDDEPEGDGTTELDDQWD